MKILWVTNILPNYLAKKMGKITNNNLGWLDYSAEKLVESNKYQLSFLYPDNEISSFLCEGMECYTFPSKYMTMRDDEALIPIMTEALANIRPDVIHIYGTEFYHTVAVVKAASECGLLDKTVISIQGLIGVCAKHYLAGLPYFTTKKYTLRDALKHDNLTGKMKVFAKRGIGENDAIKMAHNVIGRTEWDKACTEQINPQRKYFFCNETLRSTFYDGKWDHDACEKHSIFVSQSSYALKGFHQMIEALPIVLKKYPDAKVYVTGKDVFSMKWYKINSYHLYLKQLILKYGVKDNVVFMGTLDENQMKARFLQSNVFVSCSSIENSPNSLGEAMILGVPSVSSDVGGVIDLFTHNEDGFMYPYDEPYMLANYICKIFADRDLAERLSENARSHARITHDPQTNLEVLCKIYNELLCNEA